MQPALRAILQSATDLLGADEGSVMLLGPDGYLRIAVSEGIPPAVVASTRVALGDAVSGNVAATGVGRLLDGRPAERVFESLVDPSRDLRSAISIPLMTAGRMVGVLNLNIAQGRRRFEQDDLRLATVFAEQAAAVIHKAQLLEAAERREADLRGLVSAGRSLAGLLEMEPLLRRVLDDSIGLACASAGFLCLVDADRRRVNLGVYRGLPEAEIRLAVARPTFAALLDGRARPIDLTAEPALAGLAAGTAGTAWVLPMRAEGATRALLVLILPSTGSDGLRLCEAFAEQAALAIRNAQLYRQVSDKETELTAVVTSMANPVIVADAQGRFVMANPAAEELFGFSLEFVRGLSLNGVLGHPQVERALVGEGETVQEVVAGRSAPRTWRARSSVLTDEAGGFGGRVLVLEDVSTEREMERLKADFIAVIGHELRTPLTLVKGYIQTLLRRGDDLPAARRREAMEVAEAQAHRLERLIEDLLYVSGIENSRPVLELAVTDLSEVAARLLDEFRQREPDRHFALTTPGPVTILLDRTKVEQVLSRLLENACKYSDAGKPVYLEIRDSAGEVQVSVRDKGIGIVSGDIRGLFERFHQVDGSSTRERGGTGVGLYVSKSLVEAHGGRIWVESVWGKGSTFHFTIPRTIALDPVTSG
jgi:PAS domain S-box-containing protein